MDRGSPRMRILVACECSGIVRDAFTKRGHDAVSCDILPSERPGKHIVGSVLDHQVANAGWDLMIAHPDCTFLTVSANAWSGVEWRIEARLAAMHFVRSLWAFPVPRICIENPIGVLSTFWRRPDQTIQPNQFGHDASKSTCLWLKGLPPLRPTGFVEPRMVNGKPRWSNQTDSGQNKLTPSDDRWLERARTYEGIADAMAEQWGTPEIQVAA
jgi:hypothetical protein